MEDAELMLDHEVVEQVHILRLRMPVLDDGDELLLLEDAIEEILQEEPSEPVKLLINLESVECLFTKALAKLMSYRTRIVNSGGKLYLCSLSPPVEKVMRITHFDELFSIAEVEANALSALRA